MPKKGKYARKRMSPGRVAERKATRAVLDKKAELHTLPDGRQVVVDRSRPKGKRIIGRMGRSRRRG